MRTGMKANESMEMCFVHEYVHVYVYVYVALM